MQYEFTSKNVDHSPDKPGVYALYYVGRNHLLRLGTRRHGYYSVTVSVSQEWPRGRLH
jgi:hypothetical protein